MRAACGRNGNAELGGDTSRRPFPLHRELWRGLPRLFEDRGRRRFGSAATEGRFRRIGRQPIQPNPCAKFVRDAG